MELSDNDHRVLRAVETATSEGLPAPFESIARVAEGVYSLGETLSELARTDPPLIEQALDVAQYSSGRPYPMGEDRWQLTDSGREVLRSRPPA